MTPTPADIRWILNCMAENIGIVLFIVGAVAGIFALFHIHLTLPVYLLIAGALYAGVSNADNGRLRG